MKIVSLLIFGAALIGSWAMVHAPRPVAESVHIGIQSDLKNIIAEYVQKNLPESKNLVFDKFWTETVNKNQVKASFVYSFDNPSDGEDATVQIEGSALLNKVDESPETVTWSFDQLMISDNKVTFSEPIQITADAGALENKHDAGKKKDHGSGH
jgi:hypothetical protein